MNALEIEEAKSALTEQPFDADEFPFPLIQAFAVEAITLRCVLGGAA